MRPSSTAPGGRALESVYYCLPPNALIAALDPPSLPKL